MVRFKTHFERLRNLAAEHYLILLIIFFLLISHYIIVKDYNALPSPIYGGDYYFQLGATNHVKYGGNPLDSSNINGTLPGYFVMYSLIAGMTAKIFGISALSAEIIISYLTMVLSIVLIYALIFKLFRNSFIAATTAFIYHIPLQIAIKYTTFAHQFIMIAIILALYIFMERESWMSAIMLGLLLGVAGLTHSVMFISSALMIAVVFCYNFFTKNRSNFRERKYNAIIRTLPKYMIVILLGVGIALLWWFKPIFLYHGATSGHYTEVQQSDFGSFGSQMSAVKDIFAMTFVNFTTPAGIIFSLFSIAGIVFIFITKDGAEKRFIKLIFFSALAINLHFLITYNLFGFHLIPPYMIYLLTAPASLLVFAFGLHVASAQIKEKRTTTAIFSIMMVILAIFSITSTIKITKDPWNNNAKEGLSGNMQGLERYLSENTDVYDTILTTNELSFAVNAVSGRKVMISRRAQNDPFMDMDRRQVDAAVILYGNDTSRALELLKEYDVKYVYWDYYWINSEWQTDDSGRITGWFDPILTFKEYGYFSDLDRYGVKYLEQNTWVDPTQKGPHIQKFDVMIVSYQNYHNFTNPWNPDMNKYLEEVWNYNSQGQKIAVLYKVNI